MESKEDSRRKNDKTRKGKQLKLITFRRGWKHWKKGGEPWMQMKEKRALFG